MAADLSRRAPSFVALGLGGAVILMAIFSFVLWLGSGFPAMPVAFGRSALGVFGLVLSPICYAAVGGLLAATIPRNPIGWLFLAASIAIGVVLPVNLLVTSVHEPLRPPPDLIVWIAWARTSFAAPLLLPLLIVAALLFPDGHSLGLPWRAVVILTALGGVLIVLATALDPRQLWSYPSLPNPTALPYGFEPAVHAIRALGAAVLVLCAGIALASLWLRYRRGDDRVRSQLRWIAAAATFSGLAALPYVAARYLIEVDDGAGELAAAVSQVGSAALPLAAAFAISRYRLFEVDVLIGRTLVYLPLMGMLGGLYTAAMAAFQRLFVAVTGETSDLAAILAVLLVATTFTPMRRALEAAVDRRFPAPMRAVLPDPVPRANELEEGLATNPLKEDWIVPDARIVRIDASGLVACPLDGPRPLVDCLACPSLRATASGPAPAVICIA